MLFVIIVVAVVVIAVIVRKSKNQDNVKANNAVNVILENIDNISVNEKLSQQVNLVLSNQDVPDYYDRSTYYYDFIYRADEKNTKRIALTPYQRINEKIWGDGYIFQKHQAIVQSVSCFKKWLLENYYESGEEIDTSKGKVRVVGIGTFYVHVLSAVVPSVKYTIDDPSSNGGKDIDVYETIFARHNISVQAVLNDYIESFRLNGFEAVLVGTTDVSSYTGIDGDIAYDYRVFAVLRT